MSGTAAAQLCLDAHQKHMNVKCSFLQILFVSSASQLYVCTSTVQIPFRDVSENLDNQAEQAPAQV